MPCLYQCCSCDAVLSVGGACVQKGSVRVEAHRICAACYRFSWRDYTKLEDEGSEWMESSRYQEWKQRFWNDLSMRLDNMCGACEKQTYQR